MELTFQAQRRGLFAMQAITFLMYGGFFMVIPLVSIYYVDQLGFAAAYVGLTLAVRQLLQQGMTLFGGMLADRIGARGLIAVGVLIRALGFVSLAWADTPLLLMLAMVLSALGGALFDAPSRAALAALAPEAERARVYAVNGVVSGVAMTSGPLLGAVLLRLNFQWVCLGAAFCFFLVFVITLVLLPPVKVSTGQQSIGYGFGLVFRDQRFLVFTALLMGYWFLWVQITLSLPLVAAQLTGNSDSVGIVYALNAGLTVVLQYPLLRLVEHRLRPINILIIGVTLMSLGLGGVALVGSFPALLACVVVFAVGVVFASPTQQTVTAELADPRALGSYFGVSSLALAFGGSAGNLSGGWLTDIARAAEVPWVPWLSFCVVGLLCAVGLLLLSMRLRQQQVVDQTGLTRLT
jgi:DHA1 family multidrug resistance protein-like MFS transporter